MKRFTAAILTAFLVGLVIQPLFAQEPQNSFREQFNRHFYYAAGRMLSLARAMPADKFSWRPGEGVRSFGEVCMHIAQYNYYYPQSSLGIAAPQDLDLDSMESAFTGKEAVVAELERSIEHVKAAMKQISDSKLSEPAELYGRTVTGQAVLMQLITHMSEHVGQAIAYARVNEVVPPWNR